MIVRVAFLFVVVVVLAALIIVARTGSTASASDVPRIAHVVVIVFENHERRDVLGSGAAPTLEHLASTYAQATAYDAVAHPSLPNDPALVSGSTHGVTSDCTKCVQTGPTIGTQLSAKHLRWAAYAEGYPSSSRFAKKHVPFLYFPNDTSHVFPLERFEPRKLPAYSLIIPDLCHDMHDCSVATGDTWLHNFITPLLNAKDTAIFIVFDEGTTNLGGGGNVPRTPSPAQPYDDTRCSGPPPRTTACYAQSNPRSDSPTSDKPARGRPLQAFSTNESPPSAGVGLQVVRRPRNNVRPPCSRASSIPPARHITTASSQGWCGARRFRLHLRLGFPASETGARQHPGNLVSLQTPTRCIAPLGEDRGRSRRRSKWCGSRVWPSHS